MQNGLYLRTNLLACISLVVHLVSVELKYIPTCNFDSKSTEISSFEQYQTQLSKETTTETSFSLGALIPIKALQFGLGASLKFSKSEKSMSFQQSSEQTKSVTFEARAICTEFDASLKPFFNKGSSSDSTGYGDSSSTGSSRTRSRSHTHSHHGNSSSTSSSRTRSHTHSRSAEPDTEPEPPSPRIRSNTHSVSTEFADAVECLPQPGSFNTSNPLHVEAYDDFLRAFGTHFVRRVILGGKLIKSTSLNSRDVLELSKESVQVEESLSFGAQFALGSPSYVKDSLAGDGETSSSQVTVNNNCADKGGPDDAVAGAADEKPEAGGNFGFSYSEFSRTSKESESLSKIRSVISDVIRPFEHIYCTCLFSSSSSSAPFPSFPVRGISRHRKPPSEAIHRSTETGSPGLHLYAADQCLLCTTCKEFGICSTTSSYKKTSLQ